ncbi:MAG: CvpA family protein [Clostridia bacterium]|nr:CvpA family protein [Clostridia bacterium]
MGISISTIFLGVFILSIAVCFLAGIIRGMSRGIFSLILVLLCFGLVFVFEGTITSFIMHYEIQGQTVKELITNTLAQNPEMEGLVSKLVPLIEILVGIVSFIVGFVALYFVSRIIFFIGKFFIRPKKKRRLLGGVIGIVQGFIIAFLVCVPINGVLLEVNKLSNVEVNGEKVITLDAIGFDEYQDSAICNILTNYDGGLFKHVAQYADEDDGRTYTLTGQVDSVITVIKIAEAVTKLPEVNFEEGLTPDSVEDVTTILRDLEQIKNESSEEVLDTVDELIHSAVDMIGGGEEFPIDIDLSNLSVKDINFENEAVLVETVLDIVEAESFDTIEDEQLDTLVETFADSKLVLPIVEAADMDINLPDDVAEKLTESIEKLEDPEQVQRLKELFNLYGGVIPQP